MNKQPLNVPSKTSVRKAGHILATNTGNVDADDAFSLLSQWRSLHSYPINTFQATLRQKINTLGLKNAIVAQRLKRTPSIIAKLKRLKTMGLDRMQDIGGLRIVLASVDDVYPFFTSSPTRNYQSDVNFCQHVPTGNRLLHLKFSQAPAQTILISPSVLDCSVYSPAALPLAISAAMAAL